MSKFIFALFIFLSLGSAFAAVPRDSIFTLIEENDDLTFNGDKHYTQGLRLTYMHPDSRTPAWGVWLADTLPHFGMKIEAPRVGFTIGQSIYTPDNLATDQMVMNDRPYAGWLYLGLVLQREGITSRHEIPVLDTFQFHTGIIGPESFAETVQNWWHASTGFLIPRGWQHQLDDEPGFVFKHLRQWKYSTGREGFGAELLPHVGGSLGNVATFANLGAMVRVGYNLPDDWGVQTIDSLGVQTGSRSDKAFGVYGFATLDGRLVAHNAFLDGNTFHGSHHIDKNILVGELRTGLVLAFRRVDFAATYTMRTREYRGQPSNESFGSISINTKF